MIKDLILIILGAGISSTYFCWQIHKDKKNLYKVVDKLEKRISTLEKVLESHAKCIGAIRKICDE